MITLLALALLVSALAPGAPPADPFDRPAPGSHRLDVLSPTVLELSVFDAVDEGDRPPRWDFVDDDGRRRLPPPSSVLVRVDDQPVRLGVRGFRRRALHVPMKKGPLLLGSALVVVLAEPLADGARVTVDVTDRADRRPPLRFEARVDPLRRGRAVHVSQAGFAPTWGKRAFVGRYLGDAGELPVSASTFALVDDRGTEVFQGTLIPRRDVGYEYAAYQEVRQADFSAWSTPGTYRVVVPGYGASEAFPIGADVPTGVARVFAAGLYHQRCGIALTSAFTRFVHAACHLAPAAIPTASSRSVLERAELRSLDAARFPFAKTGTVDVSGGHHDAGDYGKYVATSAQMIGALVFAVDALPGLGAVDDLGLPESGDREGDLLQVAAREAAFLARMQDDDGGFFTLVQPRDRAYEGDRMPDRGDPQVVFPKSTVATAAAVAALAQLGSSPEFRRRHADTALRYVAAAEAGWAFLERAWKRYGREGAYQAIHHYGTLFDDADEIAWAATELFLATGQAAPRAEAERALHGRGDAIRRWGWWRLFEGWGGAFRACAFASASGRPHAFDDELTAICRAEVLGGATDVAERVDANAYAAALPLPDKRFRTVGWFFSTDQAFDLLAGLALEPSPAWQAAWQSCLAFETGGNPSDLSYVSGLGRRHLQEIVHQVALNDDHVEVPTGLPVGNLVPGIPASTPLGRHAGTLTWPSDDDPAAPYAPYDRSTDIWAPNAEPVTARMARSLIGAASLLARKGEAP